MLELTSIVGGEYMGTWEDQMIALISTNLQKVSSKGWLVRGY